MTSHSTAKESSSNFIIVKDTQHNVLGIASSVEAANDIYYSKYPHHKQSDKKPILIHNVSVDNLIC